MSPFFCILGFLCICRDSYILETDTLKLACVVKFFSHWMTDDLALPMVSFMKSSEL